MNARRTLAIYRCGFDLVEEGTVHVLSGGAFALAFAPNARTKSRC